MTTSKMIGKYKVELIDDNGKFLVKVYNTKAKKEFNALKHYYRFGTADARDKYVADLAINVASWNKMMADRKAARINFINPAKVGDILCSSWGYDQTNVNYYQVTKVIGKMVEVREIGCTSLQGSMYSHGMADEVIPAKNNFLADGKPLKKLVRGSSYKDYSIKIASYANAYKVGENDKHYRSWYA